MSVLQSGAWACVCSSCCCTPAASCARARLASTALELSVATCLQLLAWLRAGPLPWMPRYPASAGASAGNLCPRRRRRHPVNLLLLRANPQLFVPRTGNVAMRPEIGPRRRCAAISGRLGDAKGRCLGRALVSPMMPRQGKGNDEAEQPPCVRHHTPAAMLIGHSSSLRRTYDRSRCRRESRPFSTFRQTATAILLKR